MAIEDEIDFSSDLNGDENVGANSKYEIVSAHSGEVRADMAEKQTAPEQVKDGQKTDEQRKEVREPSLRDQLTKTYKELAEQGDRPRNPDGTFAPAAAANPVDPAQQQPQQQQPQPATQPPHGLVGADAELFAKLPPEMQQFVARTAEQAQTAAQQSAALSQIEQQIAPRRQAWALNGMSEAQAIGQLLALSDYATQDPASFIRWFSQQNSVDLEELVFGTEEPDPQELARTNEIQELRNRLASFEQQQQQAAHNQNVQLVRTFAEEKDEQGNLRRPYLTELGDDWYAHIQLVRQRSPNLSPTEILQRSYDQAVWANPTVRAKMIEAEKAATIAAQQRQEQERVRKAREAGVSVSTGVPSRPAAANGRANSGDNSVRGAIMAAIEQHS